MGDFNAWAKGSFLERVSERHTAVMAMNLMYGAAGLMRCQWLRSQGLDLDSASHLFRPQPIETLRAYLR